MRLLTSTRRIILHCVLIGLLCFYHTGMQAQINITANQAAAVLAQKLAGPGITILNPTLSCPVNANGTFTVTSSNLGLDSGIVLTTGRATSVSGNASANASTNNGAAGDPQLAALARSTTYDACKLEFDLIPKGDTVSFDYVFGSEEYNTSTCGPYNDAFAFFISGPGITGQPNIALVPGTNIPVAVNSINSGVPGSGAGTNIANCTSMGAGSPFTSYYVSNTGTTITYRGFTTILRAASPVQACSTYHLKLTIADAGNGLFDSGVFIKAGSLKTNTFSIDAKGSISGGAPFIVKGCAPGQITIKRSQIRPTAQVVKFNIGGTAVNGVDYNTIADSVVIPANDSMVQFPITGIRTALNGTKTLKLYLYSPYSCNGIEIIDSVQIDIHDGITTDLQTHDTDICIGNTVAVQATGNASMAYSWSPATGLSNAGLLTPTATPAATTTYILTTTFPGSGCPPRLDSFKVTVHQLPVISAGNDQVACAGSTIDLHATVTSGNINTLQWTGPNGFSAQNPDPSIPNTTEDHSGNYIVSIAGAYCPSATDTVHITINTPPEAPEVISPLTLCLRQKAQPLKAYGNQLLWYYAETGNTAGATPIIPSTGQTGMSTYYVSQTVNQCESKRAKIEVIVEKCCTDYIFVPTAFTPNNDGRNDRFHVVTGPDDLVLECNIFNRWGQLVFHGRKSDTWDGTFNGQLVEPGTFFYDILISCKSGNTVEEKGEVTVVR